MTEEEQAKVEKLKAETKAIYHGIALKWYLAITATILGGTPIIKIIKELFP